MSQSMTHYAVREFPAIRIACHHAGCQAVFELPLERVEPVLAHTKGACPVCGKAFVDPKVEGGADVVTALAKAVIALSKLAPQVGVYFPVKDGPS